MRTRPDSSVKQKRESSDFLLTRRFLPAHQSSNRSFRFSPRRKPMNGDLIPQAAAAACGLAARAKPQAAAGRLLHRQRREVILVILQLTLLGRLQLLDVVLK